MDKNLGAQLLLFTYPIDRTTFFSHDNTCIALWNYTTTLFFIVAGYLVIIYNDVLPVIKKAEHQDYPNNAVLFNTDIYLRADKCF